MRVEVGILAPAVRRVDHLENVVLGENDVIEEDRMGRSTAEEAGDV